MSAQMLFTFALPLVWAQQNEPDSSPILRIETGGHVDAVSGSAIDPAGSWLVTTSQDKTARLWEIASGRLLAVLRPPSSITAGALYAAAISNDGESIVVGGETDERWFGGNAAFVFNRQGHLIRVVDGIRGRIIRIAFTQDNRMLVIGSRGGIKILDFGNSTQIASVSDKASRQITGVSISAAGDVAYTAFDGRSSSVLVLCQIQSRRLSCDREVASRSGFTFAWPPEFSVGGSTLSVAERYYFSSVTVSDKSGSLYFYSVPDLKQVGSPVVEGVHDNEFYHLAWTSGDCLIGSNNGNLRFWPPAGQGTYHDVLLPASVIDAIHPSGPCDAYVLASSLSYGGPYGPSTRDVSLYRLGSRSVAVGLPLVQVGLPASSIYLSALSDWWRVGIASPGRSVAPAFNLRNRTIEGELQVRSRSYHSTTYAGPESLGRQLREGQNFDDVINALALEDRSAVIVSHDNNLQFVRSDGTVKWSVPVPNMAFSLTVSSGHKVFAGRFSDGVVRWYRFSDGKEFLAFFLHPDQKRWVLWTPAGYYDASPGGETLIGWQVNQGKSRAADFFPVSRFREIFNRPDVIDQVLDSLDEREAVVRAGERRGRRNQQVSVGEVLPPVVDIISPAQDSAVSTQIVPVKVLLRTPGDASVTSVRVRVNGQAAVLGDARDLRVEPIRSADVLELKVPIPPEDSDILIFAENKNGVSVPGALSVRWRGNRLSAPPNGEVLAKPKLYLLAVGISEYQNPEYRLNLAAKDARDFAAALALQRGKLYRDVEAKILIDRAASRDAVVDGLEWLQKQVTGRDVGMLFLAGHGINSTDGLYYFAPANFDLNAIKRTGVVFTEIKETLSGLTLLS